MNADLAKNIKRVPITEATKPKSGFCDVLVDLWWVVTPEEEVLFWVRGGCHAPQCNARQDIAEAIRNRLYPDFAVKQIPLVFVRINPHNY